MLLNPLSICLSLTLCLSLLFLSGKFIESSALLTQTRYLDRMAFPLEFPDELGLVLCILFRFILLSGIYSPWKHALVQPVPKKGDCSNPFNYRPIALTSMTKVFESELIAHLKYLESHSLL